MKRPWSSWNSSRMASRTSASPTLRPIRSASRSRILSVIVLSSARSGSCSCLASSVLYCSPNCRRYWLSIIRKECWNSVREMVEPPTLAAQETVSLVPPSPAPKSAKMNSTNRAIITHRIQLRYFTFSRRTLSIQRLLSLRAARRRREQHFTSRRPGRTTTALGRLAGALASSALLALALAWSLHPLVHDDLFWHLRTGEWIAAHRRVPLADLFSYTRLGARWITHEWGFSLGSWLIYRAGGLGGLVAATALLTLAIFAAVAWRAVDLAGAAAEQGAADGPPARVAAEGDPASPSAGSGAGPGAGPGAAPAAGSTAPCLLLAALLA